MNVLRRHWREAALALCLLGPTAALLGFGMLWLVEHRAVLPWLGAAAAAALGATLLLRALRAGEAVARLPAPAPDTAWGPAERAAWVKRASWFWTLRHLVLDTFEFRSSVAKRPFRPLLAS